jgi:hypothetical protein
VTTIRTLEYKNLLRGVATKRPNPLLGTNKNLCKPGFFRANGIKISNPFRVQKRKKKKKKLLFGVKKKRKKKPLF